MVAGPQAGQKAGEHVGLRPRIQGGGGLAEDDERGIAHEPLEMATRCHSPLDSSVPPSNPWVSKVP